jgi:DNA-binding transcriptional MerR regulator
MNASVMVRTVLRRWWWELVQMLPVSLAQLCSASRCVVFYADPMCAAPVAQADGEFTIDELAARTGMTVRTVRFYATEGLLPAPERRGRVAYYGADHRRRLELIRTLQDHGYTLSAIERVLSRIPVGAPPAEFAVHSAVLAPWLPDPSVQFDRATLEQRIGHPITAEQLGYLVQIGALEQVDADTFRASPAVLGHAVELMQVPVPTSVLHDSAAIIDEHATAVAEGLTDVFIRAIWGPYQRGEIDHEQVVALLARLRPMAVHGLVAAFGRAADRAARRGLEPR